MQTNLVNHFRKLLFFSGAFNIILASPLIFPQVSRQYIEFLWQINQGLGLGGVQPSIPVGGVGELLINTAGIDLVLIGVIVVYAGFEPLSRLFIPAANAVGRTLFAIIIGYYVLKDNIMHIVILLGVIDLLISMMFVYYVFRLRRNNTESI